MKITYDEVKEQMWEVIKDKTDFIYEPSSECDACTDRNDWECDESEYDYEPPTCNAHYDGDACRYFYGDDDNPSNYNAPACVVGNWFVHNKFTQEDLNVSSWIELEGRGVDMLINKSKIDLDDHAMSLLAHLQQNQDIGMSWGVAYEKAVAKLEGKE